ncbi:MAG TPA: dTDP-glucose 4,6-dehydratase [Trueperaceae bacterium]
MNTGSKAFASLLVTGGAGFIGSNFIRFVLTERPGVRIINLDALSYSGNPENLAEVEGDPRYQFVQGDVNDGALVAELLAEVDAVVHCAAETHVDRSILEARPFILANVLGTQTLLDALRANPKRMVHVSTDEVYGALPLERPDVKFVEDTPLAPRSPYAASKAASDLLVLAHHETYGSDVSITRCSNNFGPYQFPEKVIPLFVTNLLEGKPVPLYGDGQNVRDWLHVLDHCEAVLAVLEGGRAGEVYNVGGNNERSNLELTRAILTIMGKGEEMIEMVKDRPGHDRRYAIDAGKIGRELGWAPSRSAWPGALEDTVAWYVEHADWWRRVKSGAYREYYQQQYVER